jgi:hypothetical protein
MIVIPEEAVEVGVVVEVVDCRGRGVVVFQGSGSVIRMLLGGGI